jgi:hypothetical protein
MSSFTISNYTFRDRLEFENITIEDFDIENSIINCNSILIQSTIDTELVFSETVFISPIEIRTRKNEAHLYFDYCIFNKEVTFIDFDIPTPPPFKIYLIDTLFKEMVFFNELHSHKLIIKRTLFQANLLLPVYTQESLPELKIHSDDIHSSVWCVIKNQAIQSNDRIKALDYRKLEMDAYTRELFSKPKKCQEKTILILNKISNNHGLSWTRGLGFTLGIVLVFYYLYYIAENNFHLSLNYISYNSFKEFITNAIQFLWIPEGIKDLPDKLLLSKSWYSFLTMILSFFIGKILIAYGIYQTVAAFRKHGKI